MKGLTPRPGHLLAAAALVALLAPSFARAQAPAGTTALCGDGTYSNAATKRGACSGHKGIKTWLADQKPAAAPKVKAAPKAAPAPTPAPMPMAAKPANATGQCGDGTYTTAASQRGACSRHGGVKTWFAAAAPAPMAKPAPPRATPTVAPSPRAAPPAVKAGPKAVDAANATALCNDGTYSASQHRGGTCSKHGGVKQWLKNVQ